MDSRVRPSQAGGSAASKPRIGDEGKSREPNSYDQHRRREDAYGPAQTMPQG
jgi:hypothetical protein